MLNRIASLLLTCATALTAYASAPWCSESYRKNHFPADEYYTSYYSLALEPGQSRADCLDRTVTAARSLLAQSIYSEVTASTQSTIQAVTADGQYSERETFVNSFSSDASAHLVNVHTEQDYDEASSTAHAFAYVKRADILQYYRSRIRTGLADISAAVEHVGKLTEGRFIAEARQKHAETAAKLPAVQFYIGELTKIDPALQSEALTFGAEAEALEQRLTEQAATLGHGLNVHLSVTNSDNDSGRDTYALGKRCTGTLSQQGCNFVADPATADFVITITYSTRTSSQSGSAWFAFADVDVEMVRTRDGVALYQDSLSVKGGGGTEDKAHRKAVEQSVDKLCRAMLEHLK